MSYNRISAPSPEKMSPVIIILIIVMVCCVISSISAIASYFYYDGLESEAKEESFLHDIFIGLGLYDDTASPTPTPSTPTPTPSTPTPTPSTPTPTPSTPTPSPTPTPSTPTPSPTPTSSVLDNVSGTYGNITLIAEFSDSNDDILANFLTLVIIDNGSSLTIKRGSLQDVVINDPLRTETTVIGTTTVTSTDGLVVNVSVDIKKAGDGLDMLYIMEYGTQSKVTLDGELISTDVPPEGFDSLEGKWSML